VITAEKETGTEPEESDVTSTTLGRKKRLHSISVFGTNSVKEGATWRIYSMQEL
jgi:hypothetical protein